MDAREQILSLRTHSGMMVDSGSLVDDTQAPKGRRIRFDALVAYVLGMDVGSGGRLLDGIGEYMLMRGGGPRNYVWWGLATIHAVGDRSGPLTSEEDRTATSYLFDALDEFFAETSTERGRAGVFREYERWTRTEAYYDLYQAADPYDPPSSEDMMEVEAVMADLEIDRRKLFELVASGKLRGRRTERRLRFSRRDVESLKAAGP